LFHAIKFIHLIKISHQSVEGISSELFKNVNMLNFTSHIYLAIYKNQFPPTCSFHLSSLIAPEV
ncbi:TPA: hypothetical protein ACRGKQ_005121, partial [Klebsiella pneumoniae]